MNSLQTLHYVTLLAAAFWHPDSITTTWRRA